MEKEMINRHMVGCQGDAVVVMMPPRRLTREEAIEFAAWLVVLADDLDGSKFQAAFDKVRS